MCGIGKILINIILLLLDQGSYKYLLSIHTTNNGFPWFVLKTQNGHVDDFAFSIKITRWLSQFFIELMWYYINAAKADHLFKNNWVISPHDWPAFYFLIAIVIFRVEASGYLDASEHWRTISQSYILLFPSSWVHGIANEFGSSNCYPMFWVCVHVCLPVRLSVCLTYSHSLFPFFSSYLSLVSSLIFFLPPSLLHCQIKADWQITSILLTSCHQWRFLLLGDLDGEGVKCLNIHQERVFWLIGGFDIGGEIENILKSITYSGL